jgi:hypothetical protein
VDTIIRYEDLEIKDGTWQHFLLPILNTAKTSIKKGKIKKGDVAAAIS